MNIQPNFDQPILDSPDLLHLQPTDLNDFYLSAGDWDKTNLFFVLLASFHHYHDGGQGDVAAHASFLMAYYLFVLLTPPGSAQLALHYINQAIALSPLPLYSEWLALIEKGN